MNHVDQETLIEVSYYLDEALEIASGYLIEAEVDGMHHIGIPTSKLRRIVEKIRCSLEALEEVNV